MFPLVQARCQLHAEREAAARCPACRQSYCRECITEHDGRVVCASCLRKLTQKSEHPVRNFRWLWRPVHLMIGLSISWVVFYSLGRVLLRIPSEWHEGTKAQETLSH